jgi:hypothetical protein
VALGTGAEAPVAAGCVEAAPVASGWLRWRRARAARRGGKGGRRARAVLGRWSLAAAETRRWRHGGGLRAYRWLRAVE